MRKRCPLPPAGGENGRAPGRARPRRRPRRPRGARAGLLAGLLLASVPLGAAAWQVPADLTLEDAIAIARRESPALLRARNDAVLADEDVRQAWGQLLPSANASASMSWEGAGEQRLGSFTSSDLGIGSQPSYYFSSYNLGIGYSLDWATIRGPALARAERRATEAQIDLTRSDVEATVAVAYVDVLRQEELLRVAERRLERVRLDLRLAQGRLEVGTATPIDVGQAEVQAGRAEVAVLQARNAAANARLRLLQSMGVPVSQEFRAVTTLELSEPTWTLDELRARALETNPMLRAGRSTRDAADVAVSAARSPYFPTLSITTGWSGFTREAGSTSALIAQAQAQSAAGIRQCVATNELYARLADPLPPIDCTQLALTDARRRAILEENDRFPFDFQRMPPSLSIGLSIPIFQGFSRERNLEAARVQRDDAFQQLREQELALEADLSVSLANVRTAYQIALLEERNRSLAERQLELARERYQVGAITFVELAEAQTLLAQAEADRTLAVHAYHDAVTELESLVGTSLRD